MNSLSSDIIVNHIMPRVDPHALAATSSAMLAAAQTSQWYQCYNPKKIARSMALSDNLLYPYDNDSKLFIKSCKYGSLVLVQDILERGVQLWPDQIAAAICGAAGGGYIDVLCVLYKNIIDFYKYENAAIVSAIKYDQIEVVQFMVSQGADLSGDAELYFSYAICNDHLNIVQYMVEMCGYDCDNDTAKWLMQIASANGKLEILQYLVSLGADIRANNDRALVYACEGGHLATVKYLVSLGADPQSKGNRCIKRAISEEHLDTVKYLVSQGADIDANGGIPMRRAIESNNLDMVQYLVSEGAELRLGEAMKIADTFGAARVAEYLDSLADE